MAFAWFDLAYDNNQWKKKLFPIDLNEKEKENEILDQHRWLLHSVESARIRKQINWFSLVWFICSIELAQHVRSSSPTHQSTFLYWITHHNVINFIVSSELCQCVNVCLCVYMCSYISNGNENLIQSFSIEFSSISIWQWWVLSVHTLKNKIASKELCSCVVCKHIK